MIAKGGDGSMGNWEVGETSCCTLLFDYERKGMLQHQELMLLPPKSALLGL